jgi:hypothetical protein
MGYNAAKPHLANYMAWRILALGGKLHISLKICFIKYYIEPIKQNPGAYFVAFGTDFTIDSIRAILPK